MSLKAVHEEKVIKASKIQGKLVRLTMCEVKNKEWTSTGIKFWKNNLLSSVDQLESSY